MTNFLVIKMTSWHTLYLRLLFFTLNVRILSESYHALQLFEEESQNFVSYTEMLKMGC